MPTRPYLVLANASAGSTARDAVGTAVARLAEHAPVRLRWTEGRDEFRAVVRDEAGDDQLVIAGGDGSLHLALNVLDELGRTDRPVGVVPLGTGNDLARNHGIPLDPHDAAEAIVAGASRGLPAIELRAGEDRMLVANNLHVGLGARAAERAQSLKPSLGRLAYPVATAAVGVLGTGEPVTVVADDAPVWDGDALAVLVLLGPSMGGGVEVVDVDPTASLDVVVIGPAGLRERASLVAKVRSGQLDEHPDVVRRSASQCHLSGPAAAFADVDGELLDLATPVELRFVPDAWRVLLQP